MLAVMITAALIYFTVQNSGVLALGTACWDERLTRAGRNSSCAGEFVHMSFKPYLNNSLWMSNKEFELIN